MDPKVFSEFADLRLSGSSAANNNMFLVLGLALFNDVYDLNINTAHFNQSAASEMFGSARFSPSRS